MAVAATPLRHNSKTTTAARDAVINTPELLEIIISCLPPRDILTVVQRLSHHWKDAVDTSPIIKAKLWIQSQGVRTINTPRFIDACILSWDSESQDWTRITLPIYSCGLTLNSVFHGKTLHGAHMIWEETTPLLTVSEPTGLCWSCPTLSLRSYTKDAFKEPSFGPSRTWRDMYLTKPPITTGVVKLQPAGNLQVQKIRPPSIFLSLRDPGGITLGLLHDTIFASLGSAFHDTMASEDVKDFCAEFRFASTFEYLTEQCLRDFSDQ